MAESYQIPELNLIIFNKNNNNNNNNHNKNKSNYFTLKFTLMSLVDECHVA